MKPLCLTIVLALTFSAAAAQDIPDESRLVVKGLQAPAEVLVDRWGVPHIYAKSPADAFFVQGWNAARDRLWQMDLWRRNGLGELSAVLGEKYVAKDRAIRLFKYRGDMNKEWAAYGPGAKSNTEAFVAGINAYVAGAKADASLMPPQFALVGYEPAFWNTEDVVRIRNHTIVFSALLQAGRAQMVCKDGSASTQFLPAVSPAWDPIVPEGLDFCSIPPNVLGDYFNARAGVTFSPQGLATAAENSIGPEQFAQNQLRINEGSNNWVIGPSRTTTGRPILANDPHVGITVPSRWYITHMSAPGLNVIGAGEPIVPGVIIGHNDHIAIGMTLFPMAQEDIYVYETNPQNPNQYRYQDGWESMKIAHEAVAVRGGPDQQVELKFTRHGPVLLEDPDQHRAYALRATWLEAGGTPYMGALRYMQAETVEEVATALQHWGGPGVNPVIADTTGKIGWFPAGFTPHRPNTDGLLPLPGDGRYEWNGLLASDLLPSETNPAKGYIATANQLNLPEDYPYEKRRISFFWIDSSRFDRLSEVLDALPKSSIQDSERLQTEYVTLPGRRLVHLLGTIPTADPKLAELGQWLAAWDADVTAESAQAALYEVWLSRHLIPAVFAVAATSLPPSLRIIASDLQVEHIVDLLENPTQRLGAQPQQARDEIMLRALAGAFAETTSLLGSDRSQWQWGKLASISYEHALSPLAQEAERAKMNIGPAPKAGDASVIGVAEYDSKTFRTIGGASFRMVLDVGDWDSSTAVNSPGQSGDWTSTHYQDLFPLSLADQYFPLLYSRSAIEQATERKFLLVPVADQEQLAASADP